jgi:ribosome-binding factor A
MPYRPDRLAHELRNELSVILAREVKDPRVGFATVTQVRVSPDLRHARVFVSVFGSPAEQKETFAALHRAYGFIRRQLSGRLKLRHCPDLQFTMDDSMAYGAKMDNLLTEISHELEVSPPPPETNDANEAAEDPEARVLTATENDPLS